MDNIEKILQFIATLYEDKIKSVVRHYEELKNSKQYQSADINELATALAKAQSEMHVAVKDKTNPFFKSKYADWEAVASASFPALNKHSLSISMNLITEDNGETFFECCLMHNSGQWKKSYVKFLPPKADIQANASYNTSLKRLVVSNMIGVIIGEDDDDGNKAVGIVDYITKEQCDLLDHKLVGLSDLALELKKILKIDHLSKMKKESFHKAIEWIDKNKTPKQ